MKFLGWLLKLLFGEGKEEIEDKPEQEVAVAEPPTVKRDLTNIVEFIKKEEGFREKAYLCSGGKWTVGYGWTHDVTADSVIDEETALRLLESHVRYLIHELKELFNKSDNFYSYEIDAMVSFVYNFGIKKFRNSTLYGRILLEDTEGIKTQWMRWVYAKRKYQKGLYARRKRELKLFLTGDYSL